MILHGKHGNLNWTDGVDESLIDSDGYYYPVTTTPLLLIGNS